MQGENGFACSSCCGNDVPRPILFFVAAKKNGSACSGYRTTRSAADSNFLCGNREWFRLQRLSRQRSSASDSILRSCKEEWPACRGRRGNDLSHLILIFVAAKKNGSPAVHPQRQPKSRLRLVRCCSDSGFHGVNLGITAGFCLFTPSFVQ